MSMQSGPLWEGMTYLGIAGRRDARTHPTPKRRELGVGICPSMTDDLASSGSPSLQPGSACSQPCSPPELLLQVLDAALQP